MVDAWRCATLIRSNRATAACGVQGGLATALAVIDKAIAHQSGSTDPEWTDLLSYRDALAARQVAAGRVPTGPAPFRAGHTAPADRPDRRRFQFATNPAVKAPAWVGAGRKRRTGARVLPVKGPRSG